MKKSKPVLQTAHAAEPEATQYVEESAESRKARLRQAEREENEARQKQIAENVGTVNPNGPFVVRDGELYRRPITSPTPTVAPPKTPTPDAMTSGAVRPAANAGQLLSDPWAATIHPSQREDYGAPIVAPAEQPKQSVRKASQPAEQMPWGKRLADPYAGEAERNAAAMQNALIKIGERTVCTICRADVEPNHTH